MTPPKGKISELIKPREAESEHDKLLRVAEKARHRPKEKFKEPHIGHLLAVNFKDENGEPLETLFLDHVAIYPHISYFIFDKDYYEVMYWTVEFDSLEGGIVHVEYKEGHSIDIMRIS